MFLLDIIPLDKAWFVNGIKNIMSIYLMSLVFILTGTIQNDCFLI